MEKRPFSVTVIALILMVLCCLTLIAVATAFHQSGIHAQMAANVLPVSVQILLSYFSPLCALISAIAMFQGRNWGRYLYVIGWLIGFFMTAISSSVTSEMLPGIGLFLIFVFFLFQPKAGHFFTAAQHKPASEDGFMG